MLDFYEKITETFIEGTKALVQYLQHSEDDSDEVVSSTHKSVEKQTEAARDPRTIWNAVLRADMVEVDRLLTNDPKIIVQSRGDVGETPIHMCLIYNSDAHKEMAKTLIERYPRIVNDKYSGQEYLGENLLHIAIINREKDMVRYLVETEPSLMNGTAVGRFFKRGQPCYYGEYPLCFAACSLQMDLVEYLVSQGADINCRDSNGNTVLHLMVIHGLTDMYDKIWEFSKTINRDGMDLHKVKNDDDLTPFTLAAYLGKKEIFAHLIELRKEKQWSYGPVSCVLDPLEDLDSLCDDKGALQYIVERENVELLMLPRVVSLLKKKWESFAERHFFQRLFFALVYLTIMTVTISIRPNSAEKESGEVSFLVLTISSLGEVFILCGVLYKSFLEIREMSQQGLIEYFSSSGSGFFENFVSLAFCGSITIVACLRAVGSNYEDGILAISALFAWSYMLFFFLGLRLTGPFVVMIGKMLVADFRKFGSIYVIFLLGFSEAFYILFDESGPTELLNRIKSCFLAMLGAFEFDDYLTTRFPFISVSLLLVYVMVVSILLLNLLVAMMGDTYAKIIEEADKQWHLEWARIIFSIENEMSPAERLEPRNCYWTNVGGLRYIQVQEVDSKHFQKLAGVYKPGDDDEEEGGEDD
eukprot:TRINITY_DN477_c0_g1_i1.p1 TRINITY_DN477_c0_g1~~TRINITY_DN477_c0_g1_i1.p1  ORF type:complete len:642 (+),score=111.44 TRINITY_DN477_c0_g1_i1:45-1970(+)